MTDKTRYADFAGTIPIPKHDSQGGGVRIGETAKAAPEASTTAPAAAGSSEELMRRLEAEWQSVRDQAIESGTHPTHLDRMCDAVNEAAERLRELVQDNEHLHLANQGIHHYRMCCPDNECCRCRAEQAEADAEEQGNAASLHAEINRRVAESLGRPVDASWHDLPEGVAAIVQERDELRARLDYYEQQLQFYGPVKPLKLENADSPVLMPEPETARKLIEGRDELRRLVEEAQDYIDPQYEPDWYENSRRALAKGGD